MPVQVAPPSEVANNPPDRAVEIPSDLEIPKAQHSPLQLLEFQINSTVTGHVDRDFLIPVPTGTTRAMT